ncbi:MAG: alpha/beta hydrolase [Pseudomonadales bacterium]|nr:alpha/beta hydrolase [Pseudomonadales bacterium]
MNNLVCFVFIFTLSLNVQAADWDSSGTVETDGGQLHYRIAGKGIPLLLLHGYSGYGGQWQRFLPEFLADNKVIVVDLPGHGQSSKLATSFIVADAARDIWQLMDHLEVQQLRGVGYSAGGMTLLQMALLQPERVKAMILASSAYRIPKEVPRGQFEQLPAGYQQDLLRNHNGDKQKIHAMLNAKFQVNMVLSNLKNLRTPTLLFSGDQDELFPLQVVVETYTALPNAELWVAPGIGHALFWPWGGSDRLAREFPGAVLRFFSKHDF